MPTAYIQVTTGKVLLRRIKEEMLATTSQLVISLTSLYRALLKGIPGPLSIARHLLDLVLQLISDTLQRVTADKEAVSAFENLAFLQLSDLDALVHEVCRRKAELASAVEQSSEEIDAQIKGALMQSNAYGSLDPEMRAEVVARSLYAINSKLAR